MFKEALNSCLFMCHFQMALESMVIDSKQMWMEEFRNSGVWFGLVHFIMIKNKGKLEIQKQNMCLKKTACVSVTKAEWFSD